MRKLLFVVFIFPLFVFEARGEKQLDVNAIVSDAIMQLKERLQRGHYPIPVSSYLLLDYKLPADFQFDSEESHCGIARYSHVFSSKKEMRKFRRKLRKAGIYRNVRKEISVFFTLDGNELCVHANCVTRKTGAWRKMWSWLIPRYKRAYWGTRARAVYRYDCDTQEWNYVATDYWEF